MAGRISYEFGVFNCWARLFMSDNTKILLAWNVIGLLTIITFLLVENGWTTFFGFWAIIVYFFIGKDEEPYVRNVNGTWGKNKFFSSFGWMFSIGFIVLLFIVNS